MAKNGDGPKELEVLRKYMGEVDRFASMLNDSQEKIGRLEADLELRKAAYEEGKRAVREAKDIEHSTITLLLRFIRPGSPDIMPLFDTMAEADESVQGPGATQWRGEPIAVLGLSAAALRALIAANVVLVGQLQDLMLADPEEWYAELEGVSRGMAEAIAAKFYEYTEDHGH